MGVGMMYRCMCGCNGCMMYQWTDDVYMDVRLHGCMGSILHLALQAGCYSDLCK